MDGIKGTLGETGGHYDNTPEARMATAIPQTAYLGWTHQNTTTKRASNRLAPLSARFTLTTTAFPSRGPLDAGALARACTELPIIVERLLGDPSLRRVSEGTPADLLGAAAEAAVKGNCQDWLFTVGLGGSTQLPSPRLLALFEPVFAIAASLRQAGYASPRIRVFKADALASRVNGYDAGATAAVSEATFTFIRAYVDKFHPLLSRSVVFVRDRADTLDALIGEVIEPLADRLPVMPEMQRLAQGRSSEKEAMIYGLCHAFQLQALVSREPRFQRLWSDGELATPPSFVVPIGGIAERLFLPVIDAAVRAAPEEQFDRPPRTHLILGLGRKPAYRGHYTKVIRLSGMWEHCGNVCSTIPL